MSGGPWHRLTQTELLIDKLREARFTGKALELPDIIRLGIGQHGARIIEIRDRGFRVINELESIDGVLHSHYYLLFDPERDGDE